MRRKCPECVMNPHKHGPKNMKKGAKKKCSVYTRDLWRTRNRRKDIEDERNEALR